MAVVGSAYVVVRALTDRVESDIQRGFSGTVKSANKAGRDMGNALTRGLNRGGKTNRFTVLRDQLRDLYPEAEQASKSFSSLVRRGYVLQGALGALAGSLGALVGGLGAVAGAALSVVPAFIAVASAAITLKVATGVAKFALNGVGAAVADATDPTTALGGSVDDLAKSYKDLKFAAEEAALTEGSAALDLEKAREALLRTADLAPNSRARREAQQAFTEAELAYRRAISNREDLNNQVNKGVQGMGAGIKDPFAGLTDSQRSFAEFLTFISPLQDDLRESAANGFLPILEEQLSRLINSGLFTVLEERFYDIGAASGEAFGNFNDVFLATDDLEDLDTVLRNMARDIPSFGTIFGNLFSGLLSSLIAADPLTRRFIEYLEDKTNAWASFLDTQQANGELEEFFNQVGDNAAKFGSIFSNIFGSLGAIVAANFVPGSGGYMILDWLEEVTQAWEDADAIFLESYFQGAAQNFIDMGNAIGGAFETILRLGANPAVGEFWRILDSGSFQFQQLVQAAVETGPALADVLQTLTSIVASLADSSVPTTFFETLNFFLEGIDQMMIALKPIFDSFVGQIVAVSSALGLMFIVLTNIGTIGVGFITRLVVQLGLVVPAAGGATAALVATGGTAKAVGASVVAAMAPLAPIIAIIAAVLIGVTAVVAVKGARMEKATKGIAEGFEEAKSASDIWGEATKANSGYYANSIKSLDSMKDSMSRLSLAQDDYTYSTFKTTAIADSFGAMGRALSNVAVTDLPKAQEQFKSFTAEVGFSNEEIVTALNEMDEYKTSLIEQADQLKINVHTTDGQIDMQKLANLAIGEGETAIRRHKVEASEAAAAAGELARAEKIRIQGLLDDFIDYREGLNQNKADLKIWAQAQADDTEDATDNWEDYYNDQKFNLDFYLEGLAEQVVAQQNWKDNLAILVTQLPEEVYKQVENMGEAGADLVKSLVEGTEGQRASLVKSLSKSGTDGANALKTSIEAGLKDFRLTIPEFDMRSFKGVGVTRGNKDGGYISAFKNGGLAGFASGGFLSGAGTARSDSIPAMLSNGEFVVNARATAQNRSLLEAINSNKSAGTGSTVQIIVNPSQGMDEKALANMVSRKLAFQMRRGGF